MSDEASKTFEIVVAVRDSLGNDTGKRKNFASDSAYKIWEFYAKTVGNTHAKKRKKSILPDAVEAETILQTMYKNK
jgi:predicted Zn-dependent protease